MFMNERMDPVAFKQWLEKRTKDFAVATFKLLDALPKRNSVRVIAFQLGKSSSSIGANYREANRAESREDFRHKVSIATKEAAESVYWFEILGELFPMHQVIRDLATECSELRNLFQSISQSSRGQTGRRKVAASESNNPNNQTIKQ